MKNSKLISKLLQAIVIGACVFNLSPALADNNYTNDMTVLSGTGCDSNADCLASGYSGSVQSLLFAPTYKQANAMAAGSILHFILAPPPLSLISMTSPNSQSILTLISNTGNVADQLLASTPEIFAPGIVLMPNTIPNVPGSGIVAKALALISANQQVTPAEQQTALNTLNFDSVIGPMAYRKVRISSTSANENSSDNLVDQELAASTFIQYVTGLANPMRAADFTATKLPSDGSYLSIPQYLVDLQKKTEVRDYLTNLRTYTAQLSVGISNFYYLYHERMPITDPQVLTKALAIATNPASGSFSPPPVGPLSPLQVQQFLATRRIHDPGWYTAMQNAVPSTLLRETLFLLAELPPMLFQIHLDLERILATLSTMEIQQAGGNRLLLEQARDKVDKLLQNPPQPTSETQQSSSQATSDVNQEQLDQAKQALSSQ